MAMMITKFHKLIQSKTVWYIILGVIAISFVWFFTPSMTSGASRQKSKVAGELFGKKVTQQELAVAKQSTKIWYELSSMQRIPQSDEATRMIAHQAWLRIASLRKAESEGIVASNQEVIDQIQIMPIFRGQTGVFDNNAYKSILGYYSIPAVQFERMVREQIIVRKLMSRAVQAALVSPQELSEAYHLYTDRFVLKYALLPRSVVENDVSVTREEAEALYNRNSEAFRKPAKVGVSYVEFLVKDYVADAVVAEGAALQAYNQNIERYRIESTGDVSVTEYKPFEDVEAEITEQLREGAARNLAFEKASEFVAEVSATAVNEKADFAGAAAAAGIAVKKTGAFGPVDALPGIDETAPFRRVALGLEDDIYSSYSDAVRGRDTVYVISLDKKYASFVPGFEAVEKEATETVRRQAVTEALAAKALEVQAQISKALEAGTSFADALKPFNLTAGETEEFDLSTPSDGLYINELMPVCMSAKQGELCNPTPANGGVLISYVAQRNATDEDLGLPAMRSELINGLEAAKSQRLAQAWQVALLDEAGWKELVQ